MSQRHTKPAPAQTDITAVIGKRRLPSNSGKDYFERWRKKMQAHRNFTEAELQEAVDDLEMLDFFPKETRGAVLTLLRKMVPHKTALTWLVSEYVNHIGKWHGPAELRGVLCTPYDAAEGIDQIGRAAS